MSRKLRIEYPGAMYHVISRGDQREDIFRDDRDRQKFLLTLAEACAKTEWQVHVVLPDAQPFPSGPRDGDEDGTLGRPISRPVPPGGAFMG